MNELILFFLFFFFFFFRLTYSRWTSSLPSCLWSQRIFPSLIGSRLTFFLSRCKFSTLTTRQPMVEFYLLTFPRFPLRKKEHKSCFGKNRTHDFRTSRCADYLTSIITLICSVTEPCPFTKLAWPFMISYRCLPRTNQIVASNFFKRFELVLCAKRA